MHRSFLFLACNIWITPYTKALLSHQHKLQQHNTPRHITTQHNLYLSIFIFLLSFYYCLLGKAGATTTAVAGLHVTRAEQSRYGRSSWVGDVEEVAYTRFWIGKPSIQAGGFDEDLDRIALLRRQQQNIDTVREIQREICVTKLRDYTLLILLVHSPLCNEASTRLLATVRSTNADGRSKHRRSDRPCPRSFPSMQGTDTSQGSHSEWACTWWEVRWVGE